MFILNSVLNYIAYGLLIYGGYYSYKAYKEYSDNENNKNNNK